MLNVERRPIQLHEDICASTQHSTSNIQHSPFTHQQIMQTNLRTTARLLLLCLLLAGLAAGGEGLWIYAKARVAQVLLEISWRSALAGERVKPWPWADTRAIARLTIERDGAGIIVLAGASGRTMAFGPGHLDGTALPGDAGNCVITAHRDTHFAALRSVGPGDILTLQRPDGRNIRYRVQATRVVNKSDTSVLRQDGRTRLTLITCYPFDAIRPGTPLRWVVVAQKVG
jgi:sortase A